MADWDEEGFISLLEDVCPTLPAVRELTVDKSNGNGNGDAPLALADENWHDDPVPVKLEKIRAAFMNGRTAEEVRLCAGVMPIGDWLELVVKLSPKNIQVQGGISLTHMLQDLSPIDKEQYRLPQNVVEAEYRELDK